MGHGPSAYPVPVEQPAQRDSGSDWASWCQHSTNNLHSQGTQKKPSKRRSLVENYSFQEKKTQTNTVLTEVITLNKINQRYLKKQKWKGHYNKSTHPTWSARAEQKQLYNNYKAPIGRGQTDRYSLITVLYRESFQTNEKVFKQNNLTFAHKWTWLASICRTAPIQRTPKLSAGLLCCCLQIPKDSPTWTPAPPQPAGTTNTAAAAIRHSAPGSSPESKVGLWHCGDGEHHLTHVWLTP